MTTDPSEPADTFETMQLPDDPTIVAPDGSDVRVLLQRPGGSMAHFELAPGRASTAVAHHTVDEIWYFLNGEGEMWRRLGEEESTVPVRPGTCITIPVGTHFQFRAANHTPLAAVGITMPPWPGPNEAYPIPNAPWPATA
jgi:mannose-6-phosphate isomerase-like protein (cupin superfamily)